MEDGDYHGIVGHYDKEGNEKRGGTKCNGCLECFKRYEVRRQQLNEVVSLKMCQFFCVFFCLFMFWVLLEVHVLVVTLCHGVK